MEIEPLLGVRFLRRLHDLVRATGLEDIVGPAEIDEGLQRFASGSLPLAAELYQAEVAGEDLADIVHAPNRFNHITVTHGFLRDLLVMPVPASLLPWAERIVRAGPAPDAPAVRRAVVHTAIHDENPFRRALARFTLFEALCFNQRLALMSEGVHLEALAGRRTDVEVIAQREVEVMLVEHSDYQAGLLSLDDPFKPLVASTLVLLDEHIDVLREGLKQIRSHFHEVVERRRQIVEIMEQLSPDTAAILYNEAADEFGEEKYKAAELRLMYPGLLGEVDNNAIYKRVERLPDQVRRLRVEAVTRRPSTSFADLILAQYTEESA